MALARSVADPRVYTTGDYVDDKPPSAPRVTSGAVTHYDQTDSCREHTSLEFTIAEPATDDHAPAELLTYAVYLRNLPTKRAPRRRRSSCALRPNALATFFRDASWVGADAYIADVGLRLRRKRKPAQRAVPGPWNRESSPEADARAPLGKWGGSGRSRRLLRCKIVGGGQDYPPIPRNAAFLWPHSTASAARDALRCHEGHR